MSTRATQSIDTGTSLYLLTIRGTLAPSSLDSARQLHNETAGADANVAAARSLGDLSHLVHVPLANEPSEGAGELLIMDVWNSLSGLDQFFANPQVQEQGGRIFKTRDPVVWAPAPGFCAYHLPAPSGKNGRIVGIARGTVPSREEARSLMNASSAKWINKARALGQQSHEVYFRLAPPGSAESLELLAVDVWMDAQGMNELYGNSEYLGPFAKLFVDRPQTSVWTRPAGGRWVEW
jgi:hypothetical protein